jgi:hypothetical protein
MGHESQIEPWSPNLTTFCFAGFGTDRLRCQEAMKTADRENPNRRGTVPRNRAHGAVGQNSSRSIRWAEKQENFQPREKCFFLTSTFIELTRQVKMNRQTQPRLSLLIRRHYFRLPRNRTRIDGKCGDHFLQAKFPVPIRNRFWTGRGYDLSL